MVGVVVGVRNGDGWVGRREKNMVLGIFADIRVRCRRNAGSYGLVTTLLLLGPLHGI
jgi:hypothetical protein